MIIQLTVAGSWNYLPIKKGEALVLVKEPQNSYDDEAVAVQTVDGEPRGYVANAYKTRRRGTYSASRAYDRLQPRHPAVAVTEDTIQIEVEN